MFKYLIMLFLSVSFLYGCSSTTSQQSNIRPELQKDAKEIYTMLDNDYKNSKVFSESDARQLEIFDKKYPVEEQYNSDERELLGAISDMAIAASRDTTDKFLSSNQNKDDNMKKYLDGSEKTKKILGIN